MMAEQLERKLDGRLKGSAQEVYEMYVAHHPSLLWQGCTHNKGDDGIGKG
jgi:hypothetical protein